MLLADMPVFAPYDWLLPLTINDNGYVAGVCSQNDEAQHGFLYYHNKYWDLGLSPQGFFCLNNHNTVAGSDPSGFAVWDWDGSGPKLKTPAPLLPTGFTWGYLTGINDSGQMVGTGSDNPQIYSKAFFSDGSNSTDLSLLITDPAWTLIDAVAINNAGQIAGTGTLNGVETAYLLTPLPAFQNQPVNPLLELIYLAFAVLVDGGGNTSGGPVGPGPDDPRDVARAVAINALASRLGDTAGREAISVAALETMRRSVDRLIAQARTPAPRPTQPEQGSARLRRGRFARSPRRPPEDATKS
jgi:hypothetical protein